MITYSMRGNRTDERRDPYRRQGDLPNGRERFHGDLSNGRDQAPPLWGAWGAVRKTFQSLIPYMDCVNFTLFTQFTQSKISL